MNTYDFKTFVPRLIEQDSELSDELTSLLQDAEDVEIRIRDTFGVVYILGLTLDDTVPKAELRRVKHKRHIFEPIDGKFALNATKSLSSNFSFLS